jgi:hypothetical protein
MLNHYTGIDEMEKDMGFKIPYVQVDMGVSYNTFRDPKDFNKPPGIYWIQGSGGHYSEWDGQKFDDNTTGARKATNDYYRNWRDSCHYYATGGAGIWQEPYKGEYPKSVTLPYSGGEPKTTFLGAKMYEPALESIYRGMGITGEQHG